MGMLKDRGFQITIVFIGLFLVAVALTLEPLTRQFVAIDKACSYCHVDQEYRSDVRLAYSKAHPSFDQKTEPANEEIEQQATCAECHLAPGTINSVYVYSHFSSLTDLFGHSRDRLTERNGAWQAARQAAAFRVRDRLYEYDSPTCRSCHVEAEIEPKRERGINAHNKALDEQMTCIECHYNEKHRSVDLRQNAFAQAATE